MKLFVLTGFLIAMLLSIPQVLAQVYKWVDEHGKTQYTDRPPPPGVATEKNALTPKEELLHLPALVGLIHRKAYPKPGKHSISVKASARKNKPNNNPRQKKTKRNVSKHKPVYACIPSLRD